jgi:hypothetical protein
VRELPGASRELAVTFERGRGAMRATPRFADALGAVMVRLHHLAAKRSTTSAMHQLQDAIDAVRELLSTLEPAQLNCNLGGTFANNEKSVVSGYSTLGNVLNGGLIISLQQLIASPKGDSGLNANPQPIENADECEAGHEPYHPGQRLVGNPPGRQGHPGGAR